MKNFGIGLIAAAVAAVLAVGIATLVYFGSIKETVRTGCTVVDKDRVSKSEGGSDMRIYTEGCGNLKVSDALLKGKFNSSDTYRKLEVGHTYDLTTTGYRVGFLSAFPNVIAAEEIG